MTGPTGVDGIVGNGTGEGVTVLVGEAVGNCVGDGCIVGGCTVAVSDAGLETQAASKNKVNNKQHRR